MYGNSFYENKDGIVMSTKLVVYWRDPV